jgi:hypothetical protein
MVAAASKVGCDFAGKCRKKARFEIIFEDREIAVGRFSSKNYTEDFQ